PLEVPTRPGAIAKSRGPSDEEPLRALGARRKRIGTRVDDDESAHAPGVTRGEVDRAKTAHRVTDDDGALDLQSVEHRERVSREIGGRVFTRGPPALAVAARVRSDEPQATADRIGEEIPVAPVVTDAVEEERGRACARPRPIDQLRTVASYYVSRGHHAKYSSTVIADLRTLVDRRQLLLDFAWRELRA